MFLKHREFLLTELRTCSYCNEAPLYSACIMMSISRHWDPCMYLTVPPNSLAFSFRQSEEFRQRIEQLESLLRGRNISTANLPPLPTVVAVGPSTPVPPNPSPLPPLPPPLPASEQPHTDPSMYNTCIILTCRGLHPSHIPPPPSSLNSSSPPSFGWSIPPHTQPEKRRSQAFSGSQILQLG